MHVCSDNHFRCSLNLEGAFQQSEKHPQNGSLIQRPLATKERSLARSLWLSLCSRDSRGTSRPESVLSYHFVKIEVADVAKPGDVGSTAWSRHSEKALERGGRSQNQQLEATQCRANSLTPVLGYDRKTSIKIRGIKTRLKDVHFFPV